MAQAAASGLLSLVITFPGPRAGELPEFLDRLDGDRLGAWEAVLAPYAEAPRPDAMPDGHRVVPLASTANEARNEALRRYAGDRLVFADVDTRYRPGGLERLLEAAASTPGFQVARAVDAARPLDLGGYVLSRTYLRASGGFHLRHADHPEAFAARALGSSGPRVGPVLDGSTTAPIGPVDPWIASVRAAADVLTGEDRLAWVEVFLDRELGRWVAEETAPSCTDLSAVAGLVRHLLATTEGSRLTPVARARGWLAEQERLPQLEQLARGLLGSGGGFGCVARGGRLLADLPGLDLRSSPPEVLAVAPIMQVVVRRLRWPPRGRLELDLIVALPGYAWTRPRFEVWLERGADRIDAVVAASLDPIVNRVIDDPHADHAASTLTASFPDERLAAGDWTLRVHCSDAGLRVDELTGVLSDADRAVAAAGAPWGCVEPVWDERGLSLRVHPRRTPVEDAPQGRHEVVAFRAEGRELVVTVTGHAVRQAWLQGPHAVRGVCGHDAGRQVVRFELSDPDGAPLAPGRFRLCVDGRTARWGADVGRDDLLTADHRLSFARSSADEVIISLAPPLRPGELGRHAQRRLMATVTGRPLRNAVALTSYDGRACAGDVAAIDAAIGVIAPDVDRVWLVADSSVCAPRGTRSLLRESREGHEVAAESRWGVTDGRWLREPAAGQQVLAALRTPLPPRGDDRWRLLGWDRFRREHARALSAGRWSALSVPSEEAETYYRRAYDFTGPVLVAGTASHDLVLGRHASDAARAGLRWSMGIGAGRDVVLYEPGHDAGEQAATLAEALGADALVVTRRRIGRPHPRVRVLERERVEDIVVAADACVLGVTPLRFTTAVAGLPMVFHLTPDQARKREATPGVCTYPGPIVASLSEAAERLADLPSLARAQNHRVAAFNARFNPLDDGHAAERVARWLLSL